MKKSIILALLALFIIMPFSRVLAVGTNYRYTGKPYDANTNLYYYGQRYYDPMAGRFTQPDPVSNNLANPQKLKQSTGQDLQKFLQNPQALNSYNYVQNNPVKYVDPNGEFPQIAIPIALMVFSWVFLDDIKVAQSPDVNSTPRVIENKSVGDLVPGVQDLSKSTRWLSALALNLGLSKVSAGKQIVKEIVERFGMGSTRGVIMMYHGSANQYAEILENGFQKAGKLWLTDSAAVANAYQYKYGITDNFGLKTLELSGKLFAHLIDQGHVIIKDVTDQAFPFAREYGLDDYARQVINKIIKKE